MDSDRQTFLNLRNRPARLSAQEAAWLLGFQLHDIPVLVAAKLLKPLGAPAPNSIKYFAACDLESLQKDSALLSKATKALAVHWKKRRTPTASTVLPMKKANPKRRVLRRGLRSKNCQQFCQQC